MLFGTAISHPQPKLFGLGSLGEDGWLKTLRIEDYAPRRFRPESLRQALFPYHEAWGNFAVRGSPKFVYVVFGTPHRKRYG